jgi:hypothetical protein
MSTVNLEPRGFRGQQDAAADTDAVTRSFMRYVETFQGLDPRATLRHLHVPFVFVGDHVHASSTQRELEAFVATIMRDLASRNYARSEIDDLHVHRLSDHAAVVSTSRTRYTDSGDAIERLGETYTLLRGSNDEWRIAVAVVHGAGR